MQVDSQFAEDAGSKKYISEWMENIKKNLAALH